MRTGEFEPQGFCRNPKSTFGAPGRGDSQLLVNFSNKVYEPRDEHMEAYLAEVRRMEKQFWGLELQHVPRGTNQEADDIAKRHLGGCLRSPASLRSGSSNPRRCRRCLARHN